MSMKECFKKAIPRSVLESYRSVKSQLGYRYRRSLPSEEVPFALACWFKKATGETLDLKNPQTFNQKILWLKLYGPLEEMGRLADKYLVREWVAQRIGDEHLVPLLGVWDDPDDIDFDSLPSSFALKATHGCGWNIIVSDKSKMRPGVRRKLRKWLSIDYSYCGGFERHYSFCEPRVVAEAYLEGFDDGSLVDYKVHVFNVGDPVVLVCRDRAGGEQVRKAYYDASWNKLPLREGDCDTFDCPKPTHLKSMLEYSARLAEGFAFVRVDWYEVGGCLYFGEMTFTPASGAKSFRPQMWNLAFGGRIELGEGLERKGYQRCPSMGRPWGEMLLLPGEEQQVLSELRR